MQTVHNPQEKYSNLIFLGVNALFLLAIFWMLPVLGRDHSRPTASAALPYHYNVTAHSRTQPKPAALFNLLVQFQRPNLHQKTH